MKTRLFSILFCTAAALIFSAGCSHEVSHSESNTPGWFGGRTQTESTVTQNSDGTVSTEHTTQTTK